MKARQMGAIPPSAILSCKGVARYGGGISHWAAKLVPAAGWPKAKARKQPRKHPIFSENLGLKPTVCILGAL